jgi:hypothetical protein
MVQGAAANSSHRLSVAEINRLLGARDSEGSDDEVGGTSGSAHKKVSYDAFFTSSCILTYLFGSLVASF